MEHFAAPRFLCVGACAEQIKQHLYTVRVCGFEDVDLECIQPFRDADRVFLDDAVVRKRRAVFTAENLSRISGLDVSVRAFGRS